MNHKNAMHIVNIIGMSARRVSNPNINKTEQNTSPNMASIKEISLPTSMDQEMPVPFARNR